MEAAGKIAGMAAILLGLTLGSTCLSAQSTLGAIAGRVKDASGAAVLGVALTLRNLDENTISEVSSTPEGSYEFLNLKSGRYQITVEKSGFRVARMPGSHSRQAVLFAVSERGGPLTWSKGVNVTTAGTEKSADDVSGNPKPAHPAWLAFIRFCSELKHGEIDRLLIQDGIPVLAEMTKKKVKFMK
jgi:hypothetical protein